LASAALSSKPVLNESHDCHATHSFRFLIGAKWVGSKPIVRSRNAQNLNRSKSECFFTLLFSRNHWHFDNFFVLRDKNCASSNTRPGKTLSPFIKHAAYAKLRGSATRENVLSIIEACLSKRIFCQFGYQIAKIRRLVDAIRAANVIMNPSSRATPSGSLITVEQFDSQLGRLCVDFCSGLLIVFEQFDSGVFFTRCRSVPVRSWLSLLRSELYVRLAILMRRATSSFFGDAARTGVAQMSRKTGLRLIGNVRSWKSDRSVACSGARRCAFSYSVWGSGQSRCSLPPTSRRRRWWIGR